LFYKVIILSFSLFYGASAYVGRASRLLAKFFLGVDVTSAYVALISMSVVLVSWSVDKVSLFGIWASLFEGLVSLNVVLISNDKVVLPRMFKKRYLQGNFLGGGIGLN
jgi:hypothetical protein